MRGIIVGPAYPLRGGIANFGEALCQSFIQNNIDTSIVSFSLQYPGFLFPGKTQFDNGPAPKNIKIATLINSINPLTWIKAANYIIKQKPDFVVINYWMPFMAPSLGTIARRIRKKNIPVIAITHNVIPHEKRTGDSMLTNYFVKSCDSFITLAKSVLDDLKQFGVNKNAVFVPHPIYNIFGNIVSKIEAKKYLNLESGTKYILFFGIIRKYKGLDLLLEAMASEKLKQQNIKLIVAGEFYEDKTKYIDLITYLGLKTNVIITEKFIPSEEVKYYFCASDLIVQTYHTATQSGVTQIAYHFERPMLVTNVGGLAEIVPHNKVGYVTEKTPESIAESIFDFYMNSKENEFSKNAATEKSKFTWESMVNAILSFIPKQS